jgi:hypothetical protein
MYQYRDKKMQHGNQEGMGESGRSWGCCMPHHGHGMCQGGMGYHERGCQGHGAFMGMGKRRHMMSKMGMGYGMGGSMAPWRRFMSSEEKIALLEEYLKQLQMEEKGVQEKIELLKKKG